MNSPISVELRRRLERRESLDLSVKFTSHACVAILLRGASLESLEIAYIRRSIAPEDRWSGQVAFPGGRADAVDTSDLATALRETREEIGVTLEAHELIGRIDDLRARNRGGWLDFYVRPFVFFVERELELTLDARETADFFWVPLAELKHPANDTQVVLIDAGTEARYPAIRVKGDPPLWGLTLMMTQDLLSRLPIA